LPWGLGIIFLRGLFEFGGETVFTFDTLDRTNDIALELFYTLNAIQHFSWYSSSNCLSSLFKSTTDPFSEECLPFLGDD
jgi:hypothetical protein